jgi:type IV secretion system protein VirB5
MTCKTLAVFGAAALLCAAGPARAQIVVYDPTSYAKILQQAQTALNQLQQLQQQVAQGQQLLTSLNQISNVNALASSLQQPAMRAFLPNADAFVSAARGDLAALGAIGARAQAIRDANQIYSPPPGDRDDVAAAGETVVDTATSRLTGLKQLQSALDTAPNARAVLDLQARIAAEQAMIANDQMRLQGLAMMQAAQEQVQTQRERERAAAASDARLALFRKAF